MHLGWARLPDELIRLVMLHYRAGLHKRMVNVEVKKRWMDAWQMYAWGVLGAMGRLGNLDVLCGQPCPFRYFEEVEELNSGRFRNASRMLTPAQWRYISRELVQWAADKRRADSAPRDWVDGLHERLLAYG